jgi:hypothetical protein
MGGTTNTTDKVSNANTVQSSTGATSGTTSASGSTDPWAPTQGLLGGILGQLGAALGNTAPTAAESAALAGLAQSANAIGQFTPAATNVASTLLAGGGPDRSGLVSGAYDAYRSALTPFARGDYVNPASNPALQGYLDTVRNDVANQINAQFAGAGRDLSGANQQTLARGIAQGEAPVLMDAYTKALADQKSAIDALYGAGGTTAGLLSGLDQTRLANQQAGLDAAQTAANFASEPYNLALAAEAARRGIPLSALAQIGNMGIPIAGLGRSFTNTGATSGTTSGSSATQSSGTSTETKSTPFSPWSLAPLAFAPLSGGTSLAGLGASALGNGLFGLLSNGFMGPGSFTGR